MADSSDEARAIFEAADREIYRYSKWPTQASTYNLEKKAILDLREQYKNKMGARYVQRAFHEMVMEQGLFHLSSIRMVLS